MHADDTNVESESICGDFSNSGLRSQNTQVQFLIGCTRFDEVSALDAPSRNPAVSDEKIRLDMKYSLWCSV